MQQPAAVKYMHELGDLPTNIVIARLGDRLFSRHFNKDIESIGGFKESTATVGDDVYMGEHALVLENARADGCTRILDHAVLSGNAEIHDEVTLDQHAVVYGNVKLYGDITLCGGGSASGTWSMVNWDSVLLEASLNSGSIKEDTVLVKSHDLLREHRSALRGHKIA